MNIRRNKFFLFFFSFMFVTSCLFVFAQTDNGDDKKVYKGYWDTVTIDGSWISASVAPNLGLSSHTDYGSKLRIANGLPRLTSFSYWGETAPIWLNEKEVIVLIRYKAEFEVDVYMASNILMSDSYPNPKDWDRTSSLEYLRISAFKVYYNNIKIDGRYPVNELDPESGFFLDRKWITGEMKFADPKFEFSNLVPHDYNGGYGLKLEGGDLQLDGIYEIRDYQIQMEDPTISSSIINMELIKTQMSPLAGYNLEILGLNETFGSVEAWNEEQDSLNKASSGQQSHIRPIIETFSPLGKRSSDLFYVTIQQSAVYSAGLYTAPPVIESDRSKGSKTFWLEGQVRPEVKVLRERFSYGTLQAWWDYEDTIVPMSPAGAMAVGDSGVKVDTRNLGVLVTNYGLLQTYKLVVHYTFESKLNILTDFGGSKLELPDLFRGDVLIDGSFTGDEKVIVHDKEIDPLGDLLEGLLPFDDIWDFIILILIIIGIIFGLIVVGKVIIMTGGARKVKKLT